MKRIHLILFFSVQLLLSMAAIRPGKLTCEYLNNPQVVDVLRPRLSWINTAAKGEKNQLQTAYEIEVASSKALLVRGKADLWRSGKVQSRESSLIDYAGKALRSRLGCYWRVRVWDKKGVRSAWSEPAEWHMGLLNPADWQAQWIGAPWEDDRPTAFSDNKADKPAPLLRKDFVVDKPLASARIYISGLGYYELYMNGSKVSDDVLSPNQTDYGYRPDIEKTRVAIENRFTGYRVLYMSYDLSGAIRQGRNALGCILGNGFYNSVSAWVLPFGSPRLLAQLHLRYKDGTEEVICSDTSWRVKSSEIVSNGIYSGEHADGRLYDSTWCSPHSDDSAWQQAVKRKAPEARLEAQTAYADKVMERLKPRKITRLGEGKYRIDFGEEISGWLHLHNFTGVEGQKIDIHYICESVQGTNSYIMSGRPDEDYHARFTWFVFREVELTGWPGELSPDQVTAEGVYTEMNQTGEFACSDDLLNKIQTIWCRSLKDNAHGGFFSDCPHRERSAYTGDGHVSCEMVMDNFDARAVYTKWVKDMLLAQNPVTGFAPFGAPWQPGCGGGPGWSAGMIIIPYNFYRQYGDKTMLAQSYDGMKKLIGFFDTWTDQDGIMTQNQDDVNGFAVFHNLGDWCPPTDVYPALSLVHTFFYWTCLDHVAEIAGVLGHTADARHYRDRAEQVRQAFHRRFYDAEKRTYGPAGSNLFALRMGVPADRKRDVLQTVKSELEANNGHLYTGIYATQLLFNILAENGMNQEAFEALTKTDYPSFGYWIAQGATTTWEQWDGQNSRNHPMFGGGLTWLYKHLCGLNIDHSQPAYRHFIVRPQPPKGMTWARYTNQTVYGTVTAAWKKNSEASYTVTVDVPVGCTATVYVPSAGGYRKHLVGSGHYELSTQ